MSDEQGKDDRADEIAREALQAQRLSVTQNREWLAAILRAYADEERENWLTLAAAYEDGITGDHRHTLGERTGAHMLGALLRREFGR